MLLILGGLVLLGAVFAQLAWSAPADSRGGSVALEGYCPICVTNMGKWIKGSPAHQATYDGKAYYFPSEREREVFVSDPAKYVPALGGDCTVCYAKMGKRVPGDIRHAAIHEGRLHLFPGEKEKQAFLSNPAAYTNVDLALDGNCAVCLAHMGKQVAGKPEFTAVHNGLRYLFPSDRERQAFLADPGKYAAAGATVGKASPANRRQPTVTIVGKSGCAGCQHGVTPIGAPDTLGLAVNTPDGNVYVVEDAHKLYPQVYKGRFGGLSLKVSGEILKTEGKIAWVRPTEVVVLN
jgi:YHS domain-containing protein